MPGRENIFLRLGKWIFLAEVNLVKIIYRMGGGTAWGDVPFVLPSHSLGVPVGPQSQSSRLGSIRLWRERERKESR